MIQVFLPSTDSFLKSICYGVAPDSYMDVFLDGQKYLSASIPIVEHIENFYKENGLNLDVRI